MNGSNGFTTGLIFKNLIDPELGRMINLLLPREISVDQPALTAIRQHLPKTMGLIKDRDPVTLPRYDFDCLCLLAQAGHVLMRNAREAVKHGQNFG